MMSLWRWISGTTGPSPSATLVDLCTYRRERLRRDTWKRLDTGSRSDAARARLIALQKIAATLSDAELDKTLQANIERGIVLWTERARRER